MRAALLLCGSLVLLAGCLSTSDSKEDKSDYEKDGARSLSNMNRRLRDLERSSTERSKDTDASTGLPKIERIFSD